MKLTGQAKEDFEKWFNRPESEEYDLINNLTNYDQSIHEPIDHFRSLTTSMRYGVYVDWFDSVGIEIIVDTSYIAKDYNRWFFCIHYDGGLNDYDSGSASNNRTEARTSAIEKANEIYNNIHK